MLPTARFAVLVAAAMAAMPVRAHIGQAPYNLPVPLWMYAYGATGALVASFLVVGYFANARTGERHQRTLDLTGGGLRSALDHRLTRRLLAAAAMLLLATTIASGYAGSPLASGNFAITFFWIVVLLGATYATALLGDFYPLLDPWLALARTVERARGRPFAGRWRYPERLGYYPALGLYIGLIWLELFSHATPRGLANALVVYTVLNLAMAWAVGTTAWFRFGALFSVYFRVVALMAPVEIGYDAEQRRVTRLRLRWPFSGLVGRRPDHPSLLAFVLFMLASTAFDGIHETVVWVALFWRDLYPLLAALIAAGNPRQYLVLVNFYYYWQWAMLLLSPLVYLFIYRFFVGVMRRVAGGPVSPGEAALAFAYPLVPIAFVYNFSHYFTLFASQGPTILTLASDPFGRGWNLFGTRALDLSGILIDAGVVWHAQVWLILIGHIVSVYLAHVEALRLYPSPRQATLSQLPMLLLMVALTTIGLWILSLPIASGQVLLPPGSGGG